MVYKQTPFIFECKNLRKIINYIALGEGNQQRYNSLHLNDRTDCLDIPHFL